MTTPPMPRPLPVTLVPGITYSPLARRARVLGTGLEVWEIINGYRSVGYDFDRLRRAFDWLTEEQLRAALRFWELNPDFIAAELAENDAAPQRLQELWERYPETKPPHLR
jgi:uncharacterized protein (DUF433 family)